MFEDGSPSASYTRRGARSPSRSNSAFETGQQEGSYFALSMFDGATLLREQKQLLEAASASEIRNSLFLRLRLNARQRFTMQHNQLSERRAVRSRCATETSGNRPAKINRDVIPHRQTNDESEQQRNPYTPHQLGDVVPANVHERVHREHSTLPCYLGAITPVEAHQSVIPVELQASLSRRGSCESYLRANDSSVAQDQECHTRNPITSSGDVRGSVSNNCSVPTMVSLRMESQCGSRSPSVLCTPREGRAGELGEQELKREEHQSASQDVTPRMTDVIQRLQLQSLRANSIDEMPASVAARQSVEGLNSVGNSTAEFGDMDRSLYTARVTSALTSGNVGASSNVDQWTATPEGPIESLRPCPACGRQFSAFSRWPRHVAVCEMRQMQNPKVLGPSRNRQSTAKRRSSNSFLGESLQLSALIDRKTQSCTNMDDSTVDGRTRFRRNNSLRVAGGLQQNSMRSQGSLTDNNEMETDGDNRVQCPSCGRRFAFGAAERHIPLCKGRSGIPRTTRS
ncbi:putative zinc finger of a C2HC type [Trypanosoma vivax]|uniref:C2HC/C3H-type domain-containing protein n=1 Tax=Trypanosoma vivax (strain Y486) TaxID=1055687 RepID=G0UA17_TRYVY|nr:putative zinc finger of a C2HC type [Trypanosoma vivax]CCC52648.1 conserved hypothetical protein [Trypanosoma vivax Y486]